MNSGLREKSKEATKASSLGERHKKLGGPNEVAEIKSLKTTKCGFEAFLFTKITLIR